MIIWAEIGIFRNYLQNILVSLGAILEGFGCVCVYTHTHVYRVLCPKLPLLSA